MKLKSNVRAIRLLVMLALIWGTAARAQQLFQYSTDNGYYEYTTNKGTVAIYSYEGSDSSLAIPNTIGGLPVTSIDGSAFFQAPELTSVTIGTNVTLIGTNAFFQCFYLESVSIPASVTNIGFGPFFDCSALTTIALSTSNLYFVSTNNVLFNKTLTSLIQYPNGVGGSYTISAIVTNVGEAFIGATLSAISVNATNSYFSSTNGVLFNKNQSVLIEYPGAAGGSYTVPPTVTTIEGGAFEYGTGVSSVIIGTNVTSIGSYAFYDCASVTAISVNSTNLYYSSTNGALFDKKQTTLIQFPCAIGGSYAVPGTVTNIDGGAFGDDFSITNVFIPDSVTTMDLEVFYSCQDLISVSLSGNLKSISEESFFDCVSLVSIAIPNSVTNIDTYAFYYCLNLASLTVGTGVASIGFEAFGDCVDLTNACFEGNEPADGGSIFYYDYSLSDIMYVRSTTGWQASYDGLPTAPCAECGGTVPILSIARSGTEVLLTWPDTFNGFTLQSTTNLVSPVAWGTVTPSPILVNGLNVVTNSLGGARKFYRLSN
jgi:hypothetical protein